MPGHWTQGSSPPTLARRCVPDLVIPHAIGLTGYLVACPQSFRSRMNVMECVTNRAGTENAGIQ